MTPGNKPLTGIKVLDLSRILAGPWATQCLADYGAEVWKIEKPGEGDDTRHWGPPFVKSDAGELGSKADGDAAYFLAANRNKKSICINLSQAQGQDLVKQLAAKADIVVENYKVGGLKKYGLDYKSLSKINPKLIYLSITGFGQTGPNAQQPGYDAMIQASAGLMSITGKADHEPGGGPVKVGVAVADLMTGMYGVSAVLAALLQRANTGKGQHIDLALHDTQVAWLANQNMNYLIGGQVPERMGSAHPNIVPYQAFATADGHLMLAVGNDNQFSRLCHLLELEELVSDSAYNTNSARVSNRKNLILRLERQFKTRTTNDWLVALKAANIPCGPINSIEQALNSKQSQAREMVHEAINADGQKIPLVANPVRFSDSTISYQAPPLLGQHTAQILTEVLELKLQEINKLRQQNVIA